MIPPVFEWVSDSPACMGLLGRNPTRFWPFSSAPSPREEVAGAPYAVWQLVYGSPQNYINQRPDSDSAGIQVDAYAATASEARTVMVAIRDAFEDHGYVVAYGGEFRDPETGLYRAGFTAEFWTDR